MDTVRGGCAHLRGIPIIPLCHSGLTLAQLPVPLSEYEGLQISEPDALRSLYRTIADALGSDLPDIDFEVFARELVSLEVSYAAQRIVVNAQPAALENVEHIRNARALCISSPQFVQLGFENQLEIVLAAFPEVVPHQKVFSSTELRTAVSSDQKFDIVHIAAFVCPRSGDLYFSDVDLRSGARTTDHPDILAADALAALLELAEAKLVVIGSCDSIALGATLVNVCHVVAARDMVSANMMAAWVQGFYTKLAQRSLVQALDYALKVSQAPMRFYARQIRNVDLIFMQDAGIGTPALQRPN